MRVLTRLHTINSIGFRARTYCLYMLARIYFSNLVSSSHRPGQFPNRFPVWLQEQQVLVATRSSANNSRGEILESPVSAYSLKSLACVWSEKSSTNCGGNPLVSYFLSSVPDCHLLRLDYFCG